MAEKIVILGAGESGIGAALLAQSKNFNVFVSDINLIKENYKNILIKNHIDFEEGKHSLDKILKADLIIKSPGISNDSDVVKAIKEKGIKIVSEIEFAYKYTNAFIIAITGSNGKTTTTHITYTILKKAGLNVGVAGNIGNSFALSVLQNNYDYYVLEVSSFQLEDIFSFKPNIAIILNITQNHLNRYNYNFNEYVKAKFNIIKNQTSNDYLIYCKDDKTITTYLNNNKIQSSLIPFSLTEKLDIGGFVENDKLVVKLNKKIFTMYINELLLEGKHNQYNTLAASITAKLCDIRNQFIRDALSGITSLEHRMERVMKIKGVEFVNDSKATSVNATWYALEYFKPPIIWIAGGQDKGNDYSILYELIEKKVKAIICLGKDNSRLINALKKFNKPIYETKSMEEAVRIAYKISSPGDTVLLSPACASFDLFENFEDRGRRFKKAVRDI
ncbi:MAG: UDP-N-acetylmuramoyl-L-alanine--D-glutamate ligase [Bacteroidales bacterium]|nr:UDP-N-acetylmuramoyl-L-alanine--D-glutamate ligase [Bacteroidales bacterium]